MKIWHLTLAVIGVLALGWIDIQCSDVPISTMKFGCRAHPTVTGSRISCEPE